MTLLRCLLFLIVCLPVFGATYNWTNTWTPSGRIYNPGDTVQLWGSNWIVDPFVPTNNGTPGNPITFKWMPGCSIKSNTIQFGFIYIEKAHDLVFDGGSGGYNAPNDISMGLTDNGTTSANPPGTNTYSNLNLYFFYFNSAGATNIVIQNLTMRGLYNRMGYTNLGSEGGVGVLGFGNGITVSNCFFGEMADCIRLSYNFEPYGGTNYVIVHNKFTNWNHCITLATANNNSVGYNFIVASNWLDGGDMFETKDGMELGLHRNGIFMFSEGPDHYTGMLSNLFIYANFIRQGENPQSTTAGTSAITYVAYYRYWQQARSRIFNNISVLRPPLKWSGGQGFAGVVGIDSVVANNTCIGWTTNGGTTYGGGAVGITVGMTNSSYGYNNIIIGSGGVQYIAQVSTNGTGLNDTIESNIWSSCRSDYNIFNGQGSASFTSYLINTNNQSIHQVNLDSLSQWRTNIGGLLTANFDPNSKTNLFIYTSTYYPTNGDTVAVGAGTNLYSWGITNDYYNNPRPASGRWTIGAVEVSTNSPNSELNIHGQLRVGTIIVP